MDRVPLRCVLLHKHNLESIQIPQVLLTEHVDDPFVVGREQAYGVFKEQHEGGVDHSVGQLVGVGLKEEQSRKCEMKEARVRTPAAVFLLFYLEIQQCVQLVLNSWQGLNQLLSVHSAHHSVGPAKGYGQPNRRDTHKHSVSYLAGVERNSDVCVNVVTLSSSW